MNIIYVITSKTWGKTEQEILDSAQRLREDNNEIVIVCSRKKEVCDRIKSANFAPASMRLGGALDIFSPIHIARIARRYSDGHTINIHTYDLKGAALAIKAKQLCNNIPVNVICSLENTQDYSASKQATLDSIDIVVFKTEKVRTEMERCGFRINSDKINRADKAIYLS